MKKSKRTPRRRASRRRTRRRRTPRRRTPRRRASRKNDKRASHDERASIYTKLIKPLLFKLDPEFVHNRFVTMGALLGSNKLTRGLLRSRYSYSHPVLAININGLHFKNPLGLAAGFDKDCRLMKVLPPLSFGFEEVGSITAEPYDGNPKPRLVRLPKDKALIVYYGLKNKGAAALKPKLQQPQKYRVPIGVSIAMTNKRYANQKEKLDDWLRALRQLKDCGDYLTINLSCPNTFDPSSFCDPNPLNKLLARIKLARLNLRKPLFLKLSPDLTTKRADEIIKLCDHYPFVTGFIISNLIKDRSDLKLKSKKSEYESYPGGISGPHVKKKALDLVRHFYRRAGDRYTLIGCGGIFTGEDAYAYIRAGASLVQFITGMIFGGPGTAKRINKELAALLERDGYATLVEAVGAEHKKKRKR